MKLPADKLVDLGDLNVEYERFFSVSLDMLCISSFDGHFKKVNPAFEEVLGFSAEELCRKSYLDFIHPEDIERTTKEVEKQMLLKTQVLNFENRYRCKDGSYKWLSWKSAPVGHFMYAAARDITENKNAAEELKKTQVALETANKELESFSYSVAHDLRAPLRSIAGFSSMVLEDTESSFSEAAKEYFGRISAAAKKMGILIDGLLDLSRFSRKELIKQPLSISDLVQEVAEELHSANPMRKVDFIIQPNVIVHGDPILMKTAIGNLVGNAWKYSGKSDRDAVIEFGSLKKDGEQQFFIKDNGCGFDMKYANKLFGIFQRLHSEQEFEGTGVGLVTVQRIIRRHGGRIWFTAAIDQGATFYFTL
jgi:PAS domain S-box-containing protein